MKTNNSIKQSNFQAASIKSRPISSTVKSGNYGTANWTAAGDAIAEIGASIAKGLDAREQKKKANKGTLDCGGKDKDNPACVALNKNKKEEEKEKVNKKPEVELKGSRKGFDKWMKKTNGGVLPGGPDTSNTTEAGENGTKEVKDVVTAVLNKADGEGFDFMTESQKVTKKTGVPYAEGVEMKVNPIMQKMGIKKGGFKLRSR